MLTLCSLAYAGDYYVPEVQCGNGNMTYIGAVNPTDAAAELTVLGFGGDGTEYGASEALTSLNAMGMAYMSINDLFGENAANICWLKVSSMANLHVFAEVMNTGTRSAYWSSSKLSENLYTPHVAKNTEAFTTVIVSVNGTNQGFQTALRPKPSGSTKVLTEHATPYGKAKKNVLDLWSDVSTINWVWMESNAAGNSAMEYFSYNTKNAMASLGLEDSKGKTLRFLHVATDTVNFWTGMVYINVGDAAASVTETYYDANGFVLKTYQPDPIDPSGKVTLLFDANTQERVPAGTAWVQVTSDQDLVGYELFGSANGKEDATFAGIQGNYTHGNVLDYPYYTATEGTWAGIVAVNVGTETADLTFNLMNADGQVVDTYVKSGVAPNKKVVSVGSSMFPNAADGMWVQAKASASQFAGFMLWGDQGRTIRDNLSGVNAKVSTESTGGSGEPGERVYIPEANGNNSYANAMVLQPGENGWNINVVGNLAQGSESEVINDYGNGTDAIESIFKFTLTQPTSLVIGVRPSAMNADLDMFVVNEERPNGNFFDVSEHTDMSIDYAASGGGNESVARQYPAGTYYILVSLFDGDAIPQTDFGLLVSEFPVYLNTFSTEADLERHAVNAWTGSEGDGNGQADWEGFNWEGTKYGMSLSQVPAGGEGEVSGLESPMLDIPESGVTIIDFDNNLLCISPTEQDGSGLSMYYRYDGSDSLEAVTGFQYNAGLEGVDVDVNGTTIGQSGWARWIYIVQAIGGTSFDYEMEPGFKMAFVIFGRNTDQRWLIDNIRVFNPAVTLDSKKRAEEPARVIFNNAKPKFKSFKLTSIK
ncbi:MAG: hypothetical protein CR997_07720 [Acidobacteria bacterium]|nr:MAG: hypothetical protein CR997_07720 [Acidobacteriota bacterium]